MRTANNPNVKEGIQKLNLMRRSNLEFGAVKTERNSVSPFERRLSTEPTRETITSRSKSNPRICPYSILDRKIKQTRDLIKKSVEGKEPSLIYNFKVSPFGGTLTRFGHFDKFSTYNSIGTEQSLYTQTLTTEEDTSEKLASRVKTYLDMQKFGKTESAITNLEIELKEREISNKDSFKALDLNTKQEITLWEDRVNRIMMKDIDDHMSLKTKYLDKGYGIKAQKAIDKIKKAANIATLVPKSYREANITQKIPLNGTASNFRPESALKKSHPNSSGPERIHPIVNPNSNKKHTFGSIAVLAMANKKYIENDDKKKKYNTTKIVGSERKKKFLSLILKLAKKAYDLGLTMDQLLFEDVFPKKPYQRKNSLKFFVNVKKGDYLSVLNLVNFCKYHVYDIDHVGQTGLHWAAMRGFSRLVDLLLRMGADPNAQDSAGRTPLFLAAQANKVQAVKILLYYRANPNLRSLANKRPIDYTMNYDVRYFLNKAAQVNVILKGFKWRFRKDEWQNLRMEFRVLEEEFDDYIFVA